MLRFQAFMCYVLRLLSQWSSSCLHWHGVLDDALSHAVLFFLHGLLPVCTMIFISDARYLRATFHLTFDFVLWKHAGCPEECRQKKLTCERSTCLATFERSALKMHAESISVPLWLKQPFRLRTVWFSQVAGAGRN